MSKKSKKNTRGGSLVEIFGVRPMKLVRRSASTRRNTLSIIPH